MPKGAGARVSSRDKKAFVALNYRIWVIELYFLFLRGREVRRCWANPHSAQRPGCHYGYYSGDHYAHICTCQGDLCNGAGRATGSTVATAAAIATGAFFVIRHFGAGNLGIG